MSFPLSPTNNQIALVNGIEYYYNTTKGAWYRYGDATANVITSNTFQVLSSVVFLDTTSQNTAFTGTAIDPTARIIANAGFLAANTADQRAVTSGSYANSSYLHANAAFAAANSANITAQAAFNTANNASDTFARTQANASFGVANSASSYANGAFTAANTADQKAVTSGSYANSAYTAANTADQKAVSSGSYANSAFTTANTKYNSTGGTISGDVIVTGNLTISGETTYANSTVVNLGDAIITLNADIPQGLAPSENAGIEIDRGSSDNVSLLWNETSDKWTFTNDGTNYSQVGSAAAESYANSAYLQANAAFAAANSAASSATDTFARIQANAAFARANSGARATASNTAPTGNTVGDLWLSLTDETLYLYSYDGTSNNWVDISGPILRTNEIQIQYTITANAS